MTGLLGSMSIDGTPISAADRARMEAEEALLAERQRQAVRVVAGGAHDLADAKLLLDILGLDVDVIRQARARLAASAGAPATGTVSGKAASKAAAQASATARAESAANSAAKTRKRTAA